jgi:hypothetical protein
MLFKLCTFNVIRILKTFSIFYFTEIERNNVPPNYRIYIFLNLHGGLA